MSGIFKILIMFMFFLLLNAAATEDHRVKTELEAEPTTIPLKFALGGKNYNDAMDSGNYRYVGNSKCRLCHRKFFIGRKKDPHDHAMRALLNGAYEKSAKCLVCHATGFGVPTGFVSIEKTPRLSNVQCEGCHGPGNIHIKLAKDAVRHRKEKFISGGFLAGGDNPAILKTMCKACHTSRWDKSYHDLDKAYNKYKKANPNSKSRNSVN